MKMLGSFKNVIMLASMTSLIVLLIGCQTSKPTLTIISADREVKSMTAGVPYIPAVNGWFVPDSRMLDILNRLDAKK